MRPVRGIGKPRDTSDEGKTVGRGDNFHDRGFVYEALLDENLTECGGALGDRLEVARIDPVAASIA